MRPPSLPPRRTLLVVVLAAVLIAAVAVPATAGAGRAWKLPKATGQSDGNPTTSKGIHCGRSKFGTYEFRNSVRVDGDRGAAIFKARITSNGRGHKAKLRSLRFRGDVPPGLRQEVRQLLRSVKFFYVGGAQPLIETRFEDGSLQARRSFNPMRTRRAFC